MSEKKVQSKGSIPFAWEDKPGIRKTTHPKHDCSDINITSEKAIEDMKIPLPPCLSQPSLRSNSGKGFRWQQDPFLVAYKECTKLENLQELGSDRKKGTVGSNYSIKKSRSIFSCKNSYDARK